MEKESRLKADQISTQSFLNVEFLMAKTNLLLFFLLSFKIKNIFHLVFLLQLNENALING
jgi:hypothetical protein